LQAQWRFFSGTDVVYAWMTMYLFLLAFFLCIFFHSSVEFIIALPYCDIFLKNLSYFYPFYSSLTVAHARQRVARQSRIDAMSLSHFIGISLLARFYYLRIESKHCNFVGLKK